MGLIQSTDFPDYLSDYNPLNPITLRVHDKDLVRFFKIVKESGGDVNFVRRALNAIEKLDAIKAKEKSYNKG